MTSSQDLFSKTLGVDGEMIVLKCLTKDRTKQSAPEYKSLENKINGYLSCMPQY